MSDSPRSSANTTRRRGVCFLASADAVRHERSPSALDTRDARDTDDDGAAEAAAAAADDAAAATEDGAGAGAAALNVGVSTLLGVKEARQAPAMADAANIEDGRDVDGGDRDAHRRRCESSSRFSSAASDAKSRTDGDVALEVDDDTGDGDDDDAAAAAAAAADGATGMATPTPAPPLVGDVP